PWWRRSRPTDGGGWKMGGGTRPAADGRPAAGRNAAFLFPSPVPRRASSAFQPPPRRPPPPRRASAPPAAGYVRAIKGLGETCGSGLRASAGARRVLLAERPIRPVAVRVGEPETRSCPSPCSTSF